MTTLLIAIGIWGALSLPVGVAMGAYLRSHPPQPASPERTPCPRCRWDGSGWVFCDDCLERMFSADDPQLDRIRDDLRRQP